MCLNLYSGLKSVKLNKKIETVHLALFEHKCLMADRQSKYYELQVQAMREARDEVVPEVPENGREINGA